MEKINWQESHGNAPGYNQHTPTPWETGDGHDGNGYIGISSGSDFEHVKCIKSIFNGDKFPAKENAEFIVRAVNSHKKLLEMAKTYLHYAKELQGSEIDDDIDSIQKTIDEAEGKI